MRDNDPVESATLAPTEAIDSDHPAIVQFASEHGEGGDDREIAVSLYYAVRDTVWYDPYKLDLRPEGMTASATLQAGRGWCVPKATLLAAVCRARGIPARLGFADVRNHIMTQRLHDQMGTDVFVWHGFTEVLLGGTWWKATPAFNKELCDLAGLHPLEWDGRSHSLYHEFDKAGHKHMEYLREHGSFDDLPLDQIIAGLIGAYPKLAPGWLHGDAVMAAASWRQDIIDENRA